MTTQPSIESLFDAIDAHVIGDDYGRLSVAISELARLRQIEAGARDSEALVAELKPQATAWESIRTTLDEISPGWDAGGRSPRDCAVAWVQGAAALRAECDALKERLGHDFMEEFNDRLEAEAESRRQQERVMELVAQLTTETAKREEAEKKLAEGTYLLGTPHGIDDCPTYYDGCNCTVECLEDNILRADAAEARCEALAARVEALEKELRNHRCSDHEIGLPYNNDGIRERLCTVCRVLSSTPAADLSAHDARVRREEREAAAKKCAEAYWAMVAPKDHAAMHPTIEFWRDALGLEPMSSAEHEALAAIEPRHPEIVMVDDLAMLVRLLVHSIRKHSPDNKTARKAMDYLRRHELQGSPLRTTILSPAPDAAKPNNQQEQP